VSRPKDHVMHALRQALGWTFIALPLVALALCACPPKILPPPGPPPDGPPEAGPGPARDATAPRPAPPDPDAGPCAAAYWHLAAELACEPPAPAGATWTAVCETERAHAHSFALPCLRAAASCAAARRCLSGAP